VEKGKLFSSLPVYPLLISFLIELFPILENACGCTIGTSLTPTCAEGSLDDLYRITKLDSLNYRLVIIKPSQFGRPRFNPWVGKILWRREWLPTPVFLPGESHGQRSLVGYSPRGCKESDTTEQLTLSLLSKPSLY